MIMIYLWMLLFIFVFLAANSLYGAANKWQRVKPEKRPMLAVSMIVSVIILAWGFTVISNLFGSREQLAPEGFGLALCLMMTYQGIDPFFTNDGG